MTFRYRHVGDIDLILRERRVKPGEEFDQDEEIVGNGNFDPINDEAKAAKAKRDEEEVVARAAHEASIGGAPAAEPMPESPKKSKTKPKEA
jgi:hypothetical protein